VHLSSSLQQYAWFKNSQAASLCPSAETRNAKDSVMRSDDRGKLNEQSTIPAVLRFRTYLDAQWVSRRGVALRNTPLFVNQELGKVPFDVVAKRAGFAGLEEHVNRRSILTVYINLT